MSVNDNLKEFDALFGRFHIQDNDKGVGANGVGPIIGLQKTVQLHKDTHQTQTQLSSMTDSGVTHPLQHQTHFVQIISDPRDVMIACEHFLREQDRRELEASLGEMIDFSSPLIIDHEEGKIRGYFFEESRYCEFALHVEQVDGQLFLEGRRLDGCAFVFTNVWNIMINTLSRDFLVESPYDDFLDDDMDVDDFLDDIFQSDSEDMDMKDIQELFRMDLGSSSETVKTMIDELSDINFQETSAAKLAFKCRDQENKAAIMEHSQQLFDAIIESIMCNIALAFFFSSQLPLYRSLAVLLNTIFQTQLDHLNVTPEQYEVLVAATKHWGMQGPLESEAGQMTTSEQIAGIFSKQLSRCPMTLISEKAREDLCTLQAESPFQSVQENISLVF